MVISGTPPPHTHTLWTRYSKCYRDTLLQVTRCLLLRAHRLRAEVWGPHSFCHLRQNVGSGKVTERHNATQALWEHSHFQFGEHGGDLTKRWFLSWTLETEQRLDCRAQGVSGVLTIAQYQKRDRLKCKKGDYLEHSTHKVCIMKPTKAFPNCFSQEVPCHPKPLTLPILTFAFAWIVHIHHRHHLPLACKPHLNRLQIHSAAPPCVLNKHP